MRIRDKLITGYVVIALLTAIVGYFGGRATAQIRGKFDEVADRILPTVAVLDDLRFAGLRIVSSTIEYSFLVSREQHKGAKESAADEETELVEKGLDNYRRAIGRYKELVDRSAPEERELLAHITEAGENLCRTSGEFFRLINSGADNYRLLELKEQFEAEEMNFLDQVNRAINHERQDLESSKHQVRQEITAAYNTLVIATILAFAIAVCCGAGIAAFISRALYQLKEGAERIGRRDFATPIPVESEDEIGTLTTVFNQTAEMLRDAEHETATARAHLDNIIRSMADALFVTTPDGIIRSVNPAACTLLSGEEQVLVGRPFSSLLVESKEVEPPFSDINNMENSRVTEARFRSLKHEEIPAELSWALLKSPEGSPEGVVWLLHDIRGRKKAEEHIQQLAYFDQLTGLPNRALFQDRLTLAVAHAGRAGEMAALLFLDLDRFKDVNDTLGHTFGDLLLQAVADRLRTQVRQSDTLARLGGDEFIILVTGARDEQSVGIVARNIADLLSAPFDLDGRVLHISTSIGIVLFPHDGHNGDTLLKNADMALYAAKEKGRNCFCFYSAEMNDAAISRRELETNLRLALQYNELFVMYQPQLDLKSGKIVAVEALARWNHPEEGLIPPDRFIPIAEQTGLIHPLGEWVLRTACAQARAWRDAGHPRMRMAVNLSGHQFRQPNLVDMIEQILGETGLEPDALELELTESTLMEQGQETISTLIDLKVRGINLAIDDFGTGYSSLSYLKHFPIDRLKIDRSFIRDITHGFSDTAIIEAIIAMAHSLYLKVLAEGVETEEELAFLTEKGCDEIQGYYFARPMVAEQVEQLLAGHDPVPVQCNRSPEPAYSTP